MLDFLHIRERHTKSGIVEIYADYDVVRSKDLMIRGGDFYAIWDEEKKLWSTDKFEAIRIIDKNLDIYAEENKEKIEAPFRVEHLRRSSTGAVDKFYKYCKNQMSDNFVILDKELTFLNTETSRSSYSSKRLPYSLQKSDISAYDKLMSVLYSPEERHKIEWGIGAIVAGDSANVQKFIVIFGPPKSGKSTILDIIIGMFTCDKTVEPPIGYVSIFDAKSLGSSNDSFALGTFRSHPLVAVQQDGDLSRIEDNTRLNSLVSHEMMLVNDKYEKTYSSRFRCFLFLGTNKPVKITDSKSGLLRRLIDVSPTGDTIPYSEYSKLISAVKYEYGGIAWHCKEVYLSDKHYYDDYIPSTMLGASNDFYNFMVDSYLSFKAEDGVSIDAAWEMYQIYCDEAKIPYPYSKRVFGEELKSYFENFKDRVTLPDGRRVRRYCSGLKLSKLEPSFDKKIPVKSVGIELNSTTSLLDDILSDFPAQYATADKKPIRAWDSVTTHLSDIDTTKLHYVRPPENIICIDFDIPDETGEKNLDLNIKKASEWPQTYSEVSQSGKALHLYYIYDGDVSRLVRSMDDGVEVKVFTGKSSLRRRVSLCNDVPLAHISSGIPLRKDKKMINFEGIKDESRLRYMIEKNLRKEYHDYTKPSVDYICYLLNTAYESGMHYDVRDLQSSVIAFAQQSSHQSAKCLSEVAKAHFCSDDEEFGVAYSDDAGIVFFDVEVYPNLFIVCWKKLGDENAVVKWVNPSPSDISSLCRHKLIGFNNLNYDNYILYYRILGYENEALYSLSRKIVSGKNRNQLPSKAKSLSYTDVYDFCSEKQSLKKWEYSLGITHKEMGIPWNKPVPKELWSEVADYCANDVLATEALFLARTDDFAAREMLVALNKVLNPNSNRTVNDTSNSLAGDIIFGDDKHPQKQFKYRNLALPPEDGPGFTAEDAVLYALGESEKPVGKPYFPGYEFHAGKSTYRGDEIGEGGRVFAAHGMYTDVDDEDVASMHPSSAIAEMVFGDIYTPRYKMLVDIRIAIKHKNYDFVKKAFNGALAKFVEDEKSAKGLAAALKIVINSAYGLTSRKASDKNIDRGGIARFRDPRNVDNIVAKRGALFMRDLQWALETYFQETPVIHIKTDSVKVANVHDDKATQFIRKFGEAYGYNFEQEAFFERICLVNDAVYVAKLSTGEWTATGKQFQVPYVFKTLFSKEATDFSDFCEVKSVTTSLYLDMNESLPENEHNYVFVGRVGQFTPVTSGGGVLLRAKMDENEEVIGYSAVEGTKGYRWLESEQIKLNESYDIIDKDYYAQLADKAVETMSKFGDVEWFLAESGCSNG